MWKQSLIPVSRRAIHQPDQSRYYRAELQRRICSLAPSHMSFLDLCRNLEGAFPVDVYTILMETYRSTSSSIIFKLLNSITDVDDLDTLSFSQLENLLLDFDWRFTADSSVKICDLVKDLPSILFIGAPSVYALFASPKRRCLLIDRNPFYEDYLPQYASSHILTKNIEHVNELPIKNFSAAVIDPPWYLDDYLFWIRRAIQFLDDDATIFFPLLPTLCRPSASREQSTLFRTLKDYGRLFYCGISIAYETPSFEAAVLNSFSLPALHGWRKADIYGLKITNRARHEAAYPLNPDVELWRRC